MFPSGQSQVTFTPSNPVTESKIIYFFCLTLESNICVLNKPNWLHDCCLPCCYATSNRVFLNGDKNILLIIWVPIGKLSIRHSCFGTSALLEWIIFLLKASSFAYCLVPTTHHDVLAMFSYFALVWLVTKRPALLRLS